MFAPPGAGYDRAITIFSPDGRLFQVEYAIEAVSRGTTAVGIKSNEGVVLAVEKRVVSKLVDETSIEKIFRIDDHIGVAIAGLTADARVLVDQARIYAQVNRLTYDEPIGTESLTRRIGDLKQIYTQQAGVRPFGVKLLVAGVDNNSAPQLFMTDPSGTYWGHRGAAIGAGTQTVTEFLEKEYEMDINLEGAILIALNALKQVIEGELDPTKVEVALVKTDTKLFEKIAPEKVQDYIDKLKA